MAFCLEDSTSVTFTPQRKIIKLNAESGKFDKHFDMVLCDFARLTEEL